MVTMSPFLKLSRPALSGLAEALESGRVVFPVSPITVSGYAPAACLLEIVAELNQLYQQGMVANHVAYILRVLAAERTESQAKQDQVDLVWTGPEVPGTESRDTSIVVRELFNSAHYSVLISSFAIDHGYKSQQIFQPLAQRMDADPQLSVRMFLNVKRQYNDPTSAQTLLREFSETFRRQVWPGQRFPEVFHDPRSLALSSTTNACLHAKCIVVDDERVLITSANFTEAAHQRNIEAGVLLANPVAARAIRAQFEMLVAHNILQRVPGL